MLNVSIKVEDTNIGHIVVVRSSPLSPGVDTYRYRWDVAVEGGPNRAGVGLEHNRSDGALELLRKVLDRATLSWE